MRNAFNILSTFTNDNMVTAIVLAAALLFMVFRTITVIVQKYPGSASSEEKQASLLSLIFTVIFIFALLIAFTFAPSLELTNQGAAVVMVIIILYVCMVYVFSCKDYWRYGIRFLNFDT